jgi:hypothetical protein
MVVRSVFTVTAILSLSVACDRMQPVEPTLEARAAAPGSAVNEPSNPTVIAVSVSRIDVSWQDNSSNESGFEVHRSTAGASGAFTLRASLAANTSAYSDTGLTASTQYCYKLRAFQTKGGKIHVSAFSAIACVTTPAPPPPPPPPTPGAPGPVFAALVPGITVQVQWYDNSTNEDGFRVERSSDNGASWLIVGSTGPSNDSWVSFVDTTWTIEQSACYRVVAFNAAGDSPPIGACTAPLLGPSNLTMVGDDLTWTDNSSVESGYELWFMDDNGGPAYEGLAGTYPANTTGILGLGPCPLSWCWGWVVMAVSSDGSPSTYAAIQTRSP